MQDHHTPKELQGFLQTARESAQIAAEILQEYLHQPYKVSFKGGDIKNIVTEADHASEAAIVKHIQSKFPQHNIIGEESGTTTHDPTSKYCWIIDPLDGTNNFSHKYPFFAVSIGLQYNNSDILVGVVHAPKLQEVFYASKNNGAFLVTADSPPEKLAVSNVQALNKSLVATGFPPAHREINLPHFERMIHKSGGMRRGGAAAIDLCYLAAGRLDGFWEFGLQSWDVAAAKLIIEEAGGKVTNIDGSAIDIFGQNILATNNCIHTEMQTLLNN